MSRPGAPLTAVLDARIPGAEGAIDIAIAPDGTIAAVGVGAAAGPATGTAARVLDAAGRAVIPAPLDAHVHLDKAFLLDRLREHDATPAGAIAATRAVKDSFGAADITARSERVLDALWARGVRAARVHVEVEPVVGLEGVEATLDLRSRWAGRVDLQLVAFPQEGSLRGPTGDLLDAAMRLGCDIVGACPYADDDGPAAVRDAFDRAERFGAPVDFHVDFSDDPSVHLVDVVCAESVARGYAGRVVCGHVTSLAAMTGPEATARIDALARSGVAVVAIPTTDLFMFGGMTPVFDLLDAGVPVALGTNNHQNAFTPVAAPDPLRVAWLAVLLAGAPAQRWPALLDMVCSGAAAALGLPGGRIEPGAPADLVLLDTPDPRDAVLAVPATVARVRSGRLVAEYDRPA